jgi:glutamyl-tRNA reductase
MSSCGPEEVVVALLDLRSAPELALAAAAVTSALARLSVGEALLLATCQRLELYRVGDPDPARELATALERDPAEIRARAAVHRGEPAVVHLFRVAAGLESAALGESEVLGQLSMALARARQAGRAGPILGGLAQAAVCAGRRARAASGLGRGSLSLFGAAADGAARALGGLSGKNALVLGAGNAAERMVRTLKGRRLAELVQVARHPVPGPNREVRPWTELQACLDRADLVVAATSGGRVLSAAQLEHPRVVVDLGLPANVDPKAGRHLTLIGLEQLQEECRRNQRSRQDRIAVAETVVAQEVSAAMRWLEARRAAPLLAALAGWAETVRQRELAVASSPRGTLPEALDRVTRHLVKRLLQPAVTELRRRPEGAYGRALAAALEAGSPPLLRNG